LLLTGIDQLREGREPPAAIVHACVAAARAAGQARLAGLVNAVLRNHQRRAAALESALPEDPAIRLGYPRWLIDRIRQDWPGDGSGGGPDGWREIAEAGNRPPPLWLRINRRRTTPAKLGEKLAAAGIDAAADQRFPDALRLDRAARVSALPGFAAGEFSVQDAGAQAAAGLLDLAPGQKVLDACAAPGGKAAHILERADVDLTAVELDPARARRVGETFERLGLAGRVVVGDAADPDAWGAARDYDRILIDAPCSATGVIRRHPDIRWLKREADLAGNVLVQRAILEALWPRLAPGGLLVYATCSILHAENRNQARDFIADHADAEAFDAELPDSVAVAPGRQILPGRLDRDGFYYLRLRRLRR
ncbi:MAG: 16S rRNA (cytosine(967)-C(5))-methyltransferase RsmB, partial [Wenzhouxiangellaceae bacterium]|nr:16S rRNA (cytosine(967)-C(5))-methyltransferase RsmB [Wenzhouxiangellaceae bacterium]